MQPNSTAIGVGKLEQRVNLNHVAWIMITLKMIMIGYFLYLIVNGYSGLHFDKAFFLFVLIGFAAEIIDGSLGMAYGISCTSLLMSMGIPAKLASASVHTSEIFTTGVSGLSHIKFANIDKKLFFQIVVTGCTGAILGAYLISDFFDATAIKPWISVYLIVLGIYILTKAFRKKVIITKEVRKAPLLAFIGGLLDTIGGRMGANCNHQSFKPGKRPPDHNRNCKHSRVFYHLLCHRSFYILIGCSTS